MNPENNHIKEIKILPPENWFFLKIISIEKNIAGIPFQAYIMYVRRITSAYDFKCGRKVDLQKCNTDKSHPFDDLDCIIIEAIRNKYKDAIIDSHLIFYDNQFDDIQKFISNMSQKTAVLTRLPNILEKISNRDVFLLPDTLLSFRYELDLFTMKDSKNEDSPFNRVFDNEGFESCYSSARDEIDLHNLYWSTQNNNPLTPILG